MKYYIVEQHYIGPTPRDVEHIDFNRFEISTKPPPYEFIGFVRSRGWLGTYDNVALYAHGIYDSLEAAEVAVEYLLCGEFRRDPDDDLPQDVLAVYRPGRYKPITDDALIQWLEGMIEVSADDDEELDRQADTMIYELQQEGRDAYFAQMTDCLEFLRDSARDD